MARPKRQWANVQDRLPILLSSVDGIKLPGFLRVPAVRRATRSPNGNSLLTASNITMQFGAKPLFENVSIKLGEGNRYGLIGANGCGKSTFMKILGGELEPSAGNVSIDPGERLGKLKQDQFAYEDLRVLDVVMMGHERLWNVLKERDAIYANPDASDTDYLHAAELEAKLAELDGYTAEARASELLLGVEIEQRLHDGPMANVAPGYKLRVLLAQALFADPDILLLDEPTNHLDINTIRWLEGVLNARSSTIVVISHDRHFLNSVCTHMADLDYRTLSVYPGSYDDYMIASTQARERLLSQNSKAKDRIAELEEFVRRFRANKSKARQATSRAKAIEKIKIEDVRPSSRQNPYIRFEIDPKAKLHRCSRRASGWRSSAPMGPARRRCSERSSGNSRRTGERSSGPKRQPSAITRRINRSYSKVTSRYLTG